MELDDAVALVTGGGAGLGAAIARALAARGCAVALTHHSHRDEALALQAELERTGRRSHVVALDQTDEASCRAAVERTVDALGRLDVLVNNAACADDVPFPDLESLTPEIWDRVLDTNLRGPFLITRAAAPHLRRSGRGRVVNVAGVPAFIPTGSLALAVSKAGLVHLTRCLAVALAPEVTVNCVAPGLVEGTRMFARVPSARVAAVREQTALKRTTRPEDVARQVIAFCESDSITGQTQLVDAGLVLR